MFAEHFGKGQFLCTDGTFCWMEAGDDTSSSGRAPLLLIKGHSIFPTRANPQGHLIIWITWFVSQLIRVGATEESLVK